MAFVYATLTIPPARARLFLRLAHDFRRVMGDRFIALIAYGEADSLAFVASIHAGDLDALGTLAPAWRHDGLSTPLVLTPDEFRRSLDAFPFALAAYQIDATDFLSLLDSYRMLQMLKMEYYMFEAEYASNLASLEQAIGRDLR